MATCQFCGRQFDNGQGVRAHLRHCITYKGKSAGRTTLPKASPAADRGSSTGQPASSPGVDFDPVHRMQRQLAAENLRLRWREVRQAHADLDAHEEAERRAKAEQQARDAKARRYAEREWEATKTSAAFEAESRRRAEEAAQQRKTQRRKLIQEVKGEVVDQWLMIFSLSAAQKAQILQAIEAALSPLPVEELPKAELMSIAEAERDRIYGQAAAQQRAATARLQHKQTLQDDGLRYARKELSEIEDLHRSEYFRILSLVRNELQNLTGDETSGTVIGRVDDLLEREGLGFDDDDETN